MKAKRVQAPAAIELMPLAKLCERLENRRCLRLQGGLTRLERMIRSAAASDGANQPQLVKLQKTFAAFRKKFTTHLRAEAEIIFPLVRRLESRAVKKVHARRRLQTHARRLEQQHFEADEAFAELRALAENSCPRTLRDNLVRFEHSLHEQIYEENRFLFPRALAVSRA